MFSVGNIMWVDRAALHTKGKKPDDPDSPNSLNSYPMTPCAYTRIFIIKMHYHSARESNGIKFLKKKTTTQRAAKRLTTIVYCIIST